MYKIVDVSKDIKDIKKLHSFFKSLDPTFVPSLKRYLFYINIGVAYAIKYKNNVVGGLVMYSMKEQNVAMNYYVPEERRGTKFTLEVLELVLDFKDLHPNKPMFIKSPDVSLYRRFVRHRKDDVYELTIPDRRIL